MRRSTMLVALTALMLATSVEAATLNKCIDAKGQVTYSNLPCRNAREVLTVDIDPPPPPEPAHKQTASPEQADAVQAAPANVPAQQPPRIQLETRHKTEKSASRPSQSQCDALTDKLGSVFDKMDQARRKGYTQKQMDAWNLEVKELERKKQRAGCF